MIDTAPLATYRPPPAPLPPAAAVAAVAAVAGMEADDVVLKLPPKSRDMRQVHRIAVAAGAAVAARAALGDVAGIRSLVSVRLPADQVDAAARRVAAGGAVAAGAAGGMARGRRMAVGAVGPVGPAADVVQDRDARHRHRAAVDQHAAAGRDGQPAEAAVGRAGRPAMPRPWKSTVRLESPMTSKTRLVPPASMIEFDSPWPTMSIVLVPLPPLKRSSSPAVTWYGRVEIESVMTLVGDPSKSAREDRVAQAELA